MGSGKPTSHEPLFWKTQGVGLLSPNQLNSTNNSIRNLLLKLTRIWQRMLLSSSAAQAAVPAVTLTLMSDNMARVNI